MGKFTNLENDIFKIFDSQSWKNESIKTFPNGFKPKVSTEEFIRVTIIPSEGLSTVSCRGVLMIDIFTPNGKGPRRTSVIADKLDQYLLGKTISTSAGKSTQFILSSLGKGNPDKDNPTLYRTPYSITFNFFGVI